jgi:hypothetical protein
MFLQVVSEPGSEHALPGADGYADIALSGFVMGRHWQSNAPAYCQTVVTDSLKGITKIISTLFIALMFLLVLTITFVIGLKGIHRPASKKRTAFHRQRHGFMPLSHRRVIPVFSACGHNAEDSFRKR